MEHQRRSGKSDRCCKRLAQLVRLSFLAPAIIKRIVEGPHPADRTPRDLMELELPVYWEAQQAMQVLV